MEWRFPGALATPEPAGRSGTGGELRALAQRCRRALTAKESDVRATTFQAFTIPVTVMPY